MKFGITRWKMVPSYRGTPCFVLPLTGFFQSLVPLARPTKFATVSGVCFSNSVQRSVPAVVSKTAVGLVEAVGAAAAACGALGLAVPLLGLAGVLGLVAGTAPVPELCCAPAVNAIRK